MNLRTLVELKDYHLAEALRPRGECDLTSFDQAKWHLEVANQAQDLAEAMTTAFPKLKTYISAAANTPGDDAIIS